MQRIRLGETTAALIEIQFTSVLASNLQSRILGSTLANSGITVKIKKGGVGAAVSGGAGSFTTVDDTNAPGVRGYCPAVAELVLGVNTFVFTGTNMEPREVPVMVIPEDPYEPAYFGAVVSGTLTTSAFTTNRTETTPNAWANCLIEWLTGPNVGNVTKVGAFTGNGTVGTFTLAAGLTLPAAPTVGNVFRIVTR